MSLATVTFEMKNGQTLKCEYGFKYYPATYWEPSDTDVGDPTYFIDDEEIEYSKLPKGLDRIADDMYENSNSSKFTYSESEPGQDYD